MMNTKKEKFLTLTVRYLSKETTLEEENLLEELLKDNFYSNLFEEISANWNHIDLDDDVSFDFGEGAEDLYNKIIKYDPNFNWEKIKKNRRLFLPKVAASLAFLFFFILSISYVFLPKNNNRSIASLEEKITKAGQKSIITLFDGTKIILNANSKLRYPHHFSKSSREVYLIGEAYFEVAHDTTRPFVVKSGKVSTTVLGTKFNICAFPEDKNIKVSLVEGKVLVSGNIKDEKSHSFYLSPKQQFVFNKINNTREIKGFNILEEVGWKDNKYVFKNTPIKKVFKNLSRSFGVKFALNNDSNNKRITANFYNASFWTIVKTIKSVTKLNYSVVYEDKNIKEIKFYNAKTKTI